MNLGRNISCIYWFGLADNFFPNLQFFHWLALKSLQNTGIILIGSPPCFLALFTERTNSQPPIISQLDIHVLRIQSLISNPDSQPACSFAVCFCIEIQEIYLFLPLAHCLASLTRDLGGNIKKPPPVGCDAAIARIFLESPYAQLCNWCIRTLFHGTIEYVSPLGRL